MSVQIVKDDFDSGVWDEKAVHPMQLWEWGEARKKMGTKVARFGEFEKNNLKRVYQMTIHPIPYTGYRIGYVPRTIFPTNDLLNYLTDFCRKNKIVFVKFEPNVKQHSAFRIQYLGLKPSPYSLFPKWTMTLNLTLSEDELLKRMKPKTRYNIRLAEKRGITVKEITDNKGFGIFIKLYFETTKRQKYFGHNEQYHRGIFEALKNKNASILIAFYKDTPLAAYELFYHKDTLYYPYGGSSEQLKNLMATNLLMWEAIRFGKKKSLKSFDMWGSLPPDFKDTDMWAGFTRFKQGYGAQFTEMLGTYDLVLNPFVYNAFNTAQRLRNLLMGI